VSAVSFFCLALTIKLIVTWYLNVVDVKSNPQNYIMEQNPCRESDSRSANQENLVFYWHFSSILYSQNPTLNSVIYYYYNYDMLVLYRVGHAIWHVSAHYEQLIHGGSLGRALFLLFMSMWWDYVSELWPLTGPLFISRWCVSMENNGEMILTGETRRTLRKTCPISTLSTTNHTWTDPVTNPGLCSEKPVTNRLSYGMAWPCLAENILSQVSVLDSDWSHAVESIVWVTIWMKGRIAISFPELWHHQHAMLYNNGNTFKFTF
jgi:hypothetical protein